MATKVTITQLILILQSRVSQGIYAMARFGKEEYYKDVTEVTEPGFPTGPFTDPPSMPGQFPARETGQGADNVEWYPGNNPHEISAAYGVRGESTGFGPYPPTHQVAGGQHLAYLMGKNRLGPDETYFQNSNGFRRVFRKAARTGR